MATSGWESSRRDPVALRVENIDRMPHDVAVTVTDAAGERVFDAEFAVWHGDEAVHDHVFTTEGPYDVTVAVRYGPTERLRHDDGTLHLTITEAPADTDTDSPGDAAADACDEDGSAENRGAFTRGATDDPEASAVERNV